MSNLKSQASVTDSLNEGLRAARRSGKSYDYLAGEGDENRNRPPQKFAYHDAAPTNKRGKNFDYLNADQNRDEVTGRGRQVPCEPELNGYGDPALDSSCSGNERERIRPLSPLSRRCGEVGVSLMAGDSVESGSRPHPRNRTRRCGACGGSCYNDLDEDSEAEDQVWLAEQLALHLPDIINPPHEPLTVAKTANAGPIGLLGFGMTTILLSLVNTGHYDLQSTVPAMGIAYGGIAQFIAGLLEFSRGNTFGFVAFTAFGSFWLSLVCIWMLPNTATGGISGLEPGSQYFVGIYLLLWGFFSVMMTACTLRMNLVIFLVFFTVALLFFFLGGANMAGSENGVKAAGYEGVLCGSLALYLGFAEVVNEVWDRTILPVVPMTQLLGWFGARGAGAENEESDDSSNPKVKGE